MKKYFEKDITFLEKSRITKFMLFTNIKKKVQFSCKASSAKFMQSKICKLSLFFTRKRTFSINLTFSRTSLAFEMPISGIFTEILSAEMKNLLCF